MQYKKQEVLTTECRRKKQKQWSENLPVLSALCHLDPEIPRGYFWQEF